MPQHRVDDDLRRRCAEIGIDFDCLPPMLRERQIVAPDGLLPVSRPTWREWMDAGIVPKPVRFGAKTIAWHRATIVRMMLDGITLPCAAAPRPLTGGGREGGEPPT